MHFPLMLTLALAFPAPMQAEDAKTTAQTILTKGASLFDTRDAAAMAETYTEDASVSWVEKGDNDKPKFDTRSGRGEIEKLYREIFKNNNDRYTSKNTVEFAKFINPNFLVIQGEFEPKVGEGKWSFIQERVKVGDRWLIQNLRIYILPKE